MLETTKNTIKPNIKKIKKVTITNTKIKRNNRTSVTGPRGETPGEKSAGKYTGRIT
jgi:hypothetical protein